MMKNKFSVRLVAHIYSFFKCRPPARVERILIVSTTGLGDTLWSLPATLSLRKSFPGAKLFFLTGAFGKDLFYNSGVDALIEIPRERGVRRFKELFALYKRLRALRLDTVLFFHVQPTYALLGFLTGAKTYGNPQKVPPSTLTHQFPFTHETEHLISHRLRMVEFIGAQRYFTKVSLSCDSKLTQSLKSLGGGSECRIGFCIGSQDPYKIWSTEQFAKLGGYLHEAFDASIFLIGTESEGVLAREIYAIFPKAIDLTGKFSVRDLIHFINGLDLMIANDTGPAHIAYAVGTPCITLFSPTNSEQNGPYNVGKRACVVKGPVTCHSCITTDCKIPLCMRGISVLRVFSKAKELIQRIRLVDHK